MHLMAWLEFRMIELGWEMYISIEGSRAVLDKESDPESKKFWHSRNKQQSYALTQPSNVNQPHMLSCI
jgi:hypothetical protein